MPESWEGAALEHIITQTGGDNFFPCKLFTTVLSYPPLNSYVSDTPTFTLSANSSQFSKEESKKELELRAEEENKEEAGCVPMKRVVDVGL